MYQDVAKTIEIINKQIISISGSWTKCGIPQYKIAIAVNTLKDTKRRILEEYELYECYSCGELYERTGSFSNKLCSIDCEQREYLEVS